MSLGGIAVGPDTIAAYLAGRRWSGARGGTLHVGDGIRSFPLGRDPLTELVTVPVAVSDGVPYELLLPLAVAPSGAVRDNDVLADDGVVALHDATLDAEFRLRLLDVARGASTFESPAVVGRAVDATGMPNVRASRLGTAEQSNTSILYPGAEGEPGVILKLFRRVEAGENPDVEIGRYLTARGFPHAPRLYGTVVLGRPDGEATIAMAQALVPGAEDAWAHATRAAGVALGATEDAGAAVTVAEYAAEAGRLGAVTRALHDALAAGTAEAAFAPEPARYADVRRWAQGALAAYDAMLAAAGPAGTTLPTPVLDRTAVVERVDALAAEVAEDAGAAIRHHGDYHLGQVLRAADGALFVVDFEGEPARPLVERRRKHSPLRDVAGMLRSFAYAAGFASRGVSGGIAAARAAAWERAAREAFLAAYFGPGPAAYLPRVGAHANALVALFETEKLYYELRYELSNRPDWVDIPLRGLARASA